MRAIEPILQVSIGGIKLVKGAIFILVMPLGTIYSSMPGISRGMVLGVLSCSRSFPFFR